MLETAEIEHANTTVGSATDKDINATCAEAYIEDLLVVGNQLCLGGEGGYVPNSTGRVYA